MTSWIGVVVIKQRSREPGASTCAVAQSGAPVGRTLNFWSPHLSATRRSGPNVSSTIPRARTYHAIVAAGSVQFRTTWSRRARVKGTSALRYKGGLIAEHAFQPSPGYVKYESLPIDGTHS